ncbi:MAG TPA: hypothetical protein VFS10_19500, partial [Pyrinomonadaceae bacterium]|nr:hypothetical protein [Pyrinomonadaceae bacterium]
MAEKIVKLDAGGGLPECQITIGQGQYGKYQTFIWDTTGHDPKDVMAGTNDDTIADKFPIRESKSPTIKKVGDLDKRVFSWEIIVAAFA